MVIVSACQEISFAHPKGLAGGAEDGVRDTLSDLLASALGFIGRVPRLGKPARPRRSSRDTFVVWLVFGDLPGSASVESSSERAATEELR